MEINERKILPKYGRACVLEAGTPEHILRYPDDGSFHDEILMHRDL